MGSKERRPALHPGFPLISRQCSGHDDAFGSDDLSDRDRLGEITQVAQVFRDIGKACMSFRILVCTFARRVGWPARLCIPPSPGGCAFLRNFEIRADFHTTPQTLSLIAVCARARARVGVCIHACPACYLRSFRSG